MIDIFSTGGAFYGLDISYEMMLHILSDDFIMPETYLSLQFEDGVKCSIRKKDIVGICEHTEEMEEEEEI